MVEIFTDIPETVKQQTELVVDLAFSKKNIVDIVRALNEYTDSCENEEEKEFVKFYINMKLEELQNGSFSIER